MTEENSVAEKIDQQMAPVESKSTGESLVKSDDTLSNSHDNGEAAAEQQPNGEEQHDQQAPGDVVEQNIDKSSAVSTDANVEEPKTESVEPSEPQEPPEPVELVDGKPTITEAPAADETPVVPPEDVASGPAAPEEEEQQEETAEKATAPKRGRPKGKQPAAGGRRGRKPKGAADAGEVADEPKEKEELEATEAKEEDKPAAEAPAPPARKGRKRGATADVNARAKKESKGEEGGTSGGQEGAAVEKKTPLLETPLVIEGKRQRQKVERLDLTASAHSKESAEVPDGSGIKLGDLPFIEAMIAKTNTDDLKPLHRVCFGRAGQTHEIRKHLRVFCGFDFEKDTEQYTRKMKQMDNWSMKQLKQICQVLGVERSGKKDELQHAVLEYLLKPTDVGKKAPQAKKGKGSPGRKKGGATSTGAGRRKRSAPAAVSESEEGEEEKEEEDEEEESIEKEPEQPKAKRAKKEAASTSSKPTRRGRGAGKAAKKDPPTDDALRDTIKELLQGANLEEVTMRDMCRKVYAKFPDFDLTSRKDFIKNTVKSVISSSGE